MENKQEPKMKKPIKISLRVISFPFAFGFILIAALRHLLMRSFEWIFYGGELTQYSKELNVSITQKEYLDFLEYKKNTKNPTKPQSN